MLFSRKCHLNVSLKSFQYMGKIFLLTYSRYLSNKSGIKLSAAGKKDTCKFAKKIILELGEDIKNTMILAPTSPQEKETAELLQNELGIKNLTIFDEDKLGVDVKKIIKKFGFTFKKSSKNMNTQNLIFVTASSFIECTILFEWDKYTGSFGPNTGVLIENSHFTFFPEKIT